MTLQDIAAMDSVLIGTKEVAAVTGTDRYTVNRMAAEGDVFGCRPFYVGRHGKWVKVSRLEFLRNMGYEHETAGV